MGITGVQLLQSVIILVPHVQIGCTVSSLRNFYSSNISSSTCQVQDPVMQGEQFRVGYFAFTIHEQCFQPEIVLITGVCR